MNFIKNYWKQFQYQLSIFSHCLWGPKLWVVEIKLHSLKGCGKNLVKKESESSKKCEENK